MGQRMGRYLYFIAAILERSDFNPLVQMGNGGWEGRRVGWNGSECAM